MVHNQEINKKKDKPRLSYTPTVNTMTAGRLTLQGTYLDGLAQDCNSSALATELAQSCAKPSIWYNQNEPSTIKVNNKNLSLIA